MSLGLRKALQFYNNESDTCIPSILSEVSTNMKSYPYILQSLGCLFASLVLK